MSDKPNKQNNQKPGQPQRNTRTIAVWVVILCLIGFFLGSQFLTMGQGNTVDKLDTGEFVQAVEQDRVTSVVYAASDYTVNGTYYPASTPGATMVDAFNTGLDAMNALMSQQTDRSGNRLGGLTTKTLDTLPLGTERDYTSVYVGADSLGDMLAAHPEVQYEITLPSGWTSILISILPFLLIAALLFRSGDKS